MIIRLTMLGTGNALVTNCYNTCFILEEGNKQFMVDGGCLAFPNQRDQVRLDGH